MRKTDQPPLPFEPPRRARMRDVRRRPQHRLKAAWRTARRHPRRSFNSTCAFVARWVLRLGLPIAGADAMLRLFPYDATVGGVRFSIAGSLFSRPGISADTTIGSWEFPHVDGLPVGVHVSPVNVDVVTLAANATHGGQAYVDTLTDDFRRQLPWIAAWLVGEILVGVALGLVVAACLNLAIRHLRGGARTPGELRRRARQAVVALSVVCVVAAYGVVSFNRDWAKQSRATGTLAAIQLFPGQLSDYYHRQSKFFDVVGAIVGIQEQLQQKIGSPADDATSYNVMFISDMHLAATYPLVQEYAKNFSVKLIVNTGDESEFGTSFEMTPSYLQQIRDITQSIPMIWVAGNHDSPTTADIMASIPGVIVLGSKTIDGHGGYTVRAQKIRAYGLTIAGLPDPRVYGAAFPWGSDDLSVVDKLERHAVDVATQGIPKSASFDIFASHEPNATSQLRHDLPGQIRQTNAGHTHHQNKASDVQTTDGINLVEGSTGAGGLDNINRGVPPPPIEFSIESVGLNCQFTKVVRFQITGPAPTNTNVIPTTGQHVTATTLYLKAQHVAEGRTCVTALGVGAVHALP